MQPTGITRTVRPVYDYRGRQLDIEVPVKDKMEGDIEFVDNTPNAELPKERGDTAAVMFGDTALAIIGGYRTFASPYPSRDLISNPYPTLPYYLNDVWEFDGNLWKDFSMFFLIPS